MCDDTMILQVRYQLIVIETEYFCLSAGGISFLQSFALRAFTLTKNLGEKKLKNAVFCPTKHVR